MKRDKRVTSPDNWHPTSDEGTVRVSIHHDRLKTKNGWRVAVWGDDDFGMERDGLDITTAFNMFRRIKDGVTQSDLRKRGFVVA